MAASIRAEAGPDGRGTAIEITLPVADGRSPGPAGHGLTRILVIDDEAPIRRFLRIALSGDGYEVIEADRGRGGIEAAATGAPTS